MGGIKHNQNSTNGNFHKTFQQLRATAERKQKKSLIFKVWVQISDLDEG